jgi:DNA-directed RNA polymerase sigma subunit (sigma70/sigma32)
MQAVMSWAIEGTKAICPSASAGAAPAWAPTSQPRPGQGERLSWMRSKQLDADAQIVERCLSGDDGAWEELIHTHGRRVYSICFRFTGSEAEAQDLAQDVFLRLYKSLASFRPHEGSFQVWLARMARNLLIDHYRKTRMQRATDSIENQLPVLEQRLLATGRMPCWQDGKPGN